MVLNHAGTKVTINTGKTLRIRTEGNDYEYAATKERVLHRAIAAQLIAEGVGT